MYRHFFKPVFDFSCSLIGIIVISPVIIFFSIVLFFTNRGNPFFFQSRPGRNGRIISVIKFRTMSEKRDTGGALLPDDQRLTPVGRFIRRTSIDELPQLLSVLKGDMSLVGPRPLLLEYLTLYNKEQARRHEVKPGITGWAQVNGRNSLTWEEKFNLDIWYVDNMSFFLDIKILWMTLLKVLKAENIYSMQGNIMEPFKGSGK